MVLSLSLGSRKEVLGAAQLSDLLLAALPER